MLPRQSEQPDRAFPRIVQQSKAIFLVTPEGRSWRVYDGLDDEGIGRTEPAEKSSAPARLFLESTAPFERRIHLFRSGEARSIDAKSLYAELKDSKPLRSMEE